MKSGSSRYVFFFCGFAFKIPSISSYKQFLWGLIANLNEIEFYQYLKSDKLCPIKFYLPLGICNIMPAIKTLSENEFKDFDPIKFCCLDNECKIPAESKADSFGWYKGKIVVIDYG